jgi:hypothetical protein
MSDLDAAFYVQVGFHVVQFALLGYLWGRVIRSDRKIKNFEKNPFPWVNGQQSKNGYAPRSY